MNITLTLDLATIIKEAVAEDRIKPLINKAISDAVTDAIRDATDYSSPFRKTLKEQLRNELPGGLDIDDQAKFQLMFNKALSEAVHGANADIIKTAMKKAMKEAVTEIPARYKLSDLVTKAREALHKEEYEAFYARFEESEYGSYHLYLDADEDNRNKFNADYRVDINKEGHVYALHIDNKPVTENSTPFVIGDFRGLLLSLYVGRTVIDIDINADEVSSIAAQPEP